jgi:uncharacterized repeat protein (TIGR03803 family)
MQFFQSLRRRKSPANRRRHSGTASSRVRLRVEEFETRVTPALITTSFVAPQGLYSAANLLMDSSGNLYGTAVTGGAAGDGAVFELVHNSGTLTTLAAFNGGNGANPHSSLIMDGSGNLYGTTANGGSANDGTVFELAAGSSTITTLASFTGANGANPEAGLVMDVSGNLYGTTANGGASNDGTVFELAAGSGTITTRASFNGTNGSGPLGVLVLDGSGNLYGTTNLGGSSSDGTVFEVAAGSGTITTLASFNGTNGSSPEGNLLMDSSGNLYGAAAYGGASGYGTVFEVVHGSNAITTLASFPGGNESNPEECNLVMDAQGNLYGTAGARNTGYSGAVFEVVAGSGKITTLATFTTTTSKKGKTSTNNGSDPIGGVVRDSQGNLYGVTVGGGTSGDGTIFEVVAGSGKVTTLASFSGSNGNFPQAGLISDGSGNLYGTTDQGGAANDGVVFELAAGSHTLTALVSFNGANGAGPAAGLLMDSSGNLYGTTTQGGGSGPGVVFELTTGGSGAPLLRASSPVAPPGSSPGGAPASATPVRHPAPRGAGPSTALRGVSREVLDQFFADIDPSWLPVSPKKRHP